MIVKSFDVCSSCGRTHNIDKKSLSEGREYYSCSECRMWDKKSRSYVPFDFLSSMKRKLKNTELVNEIWKSIYDEVLSVGKNVEYVRLWDSIDFVCSTIFCLFVFIRLHL